MRIRLFFHKTEAMRYTGHLDLHRTWERTFRRAQLPLAYSQGFHPQPRINLAAALPLGFTSESEIADVWLEQDLPLPDIQRALEGAVPPGIMVHAIEEVEGRQPPLQTLVRSADYTTTLLAPAGDLDAKIRALLACEKIERERRGKAYDLRPLLEDLQRLPDDEMGRARLSMRLASREGATGRPEEVLAALGFPAESARVQRTRLILANP